MFYVTSLDGRQVEPLINIGTDFRMEQSVDGAFQVSFTCLPSYPYPDNPGYDILRSESVLTIDGFDFKVKQYSDSGYTKRITAINTFFEHSTTYIDGIFSGSHSLTNHLNYILANTGWTFTVDSSVANLTNYIQNFGNSNVIALLNKICKYHQVEFIINSSRSIHIAKQIGPDNDYQYRYSHNVSDVVLLEDTTNLRTYIRGFGFEGLEVSYTSPNYQTFGKKEHEPIRDERFKDAVALTNYIKATITDTPELTIESKIPELTNRETGERIWLIYEPLKVEMQTRILKQTKVIRDDKLVTESVIFGTTLVKTSTDILLEQQEQLNDNKELIDDTKDIIDEDIKKVQEAILIQWEETEERIIDQHQTITSEYTAAISANAREIRTDMTQMSTDINKTIGAQYTTIKSEYTSAISQTAQAIRTDVNASITSVNGAIQDVRTYASSIEQSASQIQSTVASQQVQINDQGTRIGWAESSITQNANSISSKVSQSDFTGATITSKINQDPWAVSISASKINLNGAVIVNGTISGASVINVTEDINIGNRIKFNDMTEIWSYSQNMQIDAYNDLTLNASNIRFYGNVDFSGAYNITGLQASSVGGYTFSHSGRNLTVRHNGSYIGIIALSA